MQNESKCRNRLKAIGHFFAYVFAAVFLTHCYQVQSSKREEAQKIMNETSTLIMKRMYELEQVNFALQSGRLNDAQDFFGTGSVEFFSNAM